MEARLEPQDVVLALKIVVENRSTWIQEDLATALHVSASEVNHGLQRLAACHSTTLASAASFERA